MEQNGEATVESVDFHRCDNDTFLQDGIFHKGDMKKLIPKQEIESQYKNKGTHIERLIICSQKAIFKAKSS
jgi:hypothetical protein